MKRTFSRSVAIAMLGGIIAAAALRNVLLAAYLAAAPSLGLVVAILAYKSVRHVSHWYWSMSMLHAEGSPRRQRIAQRVELSV